MAIKEEIYKEVGVNYRFFLGWRHASFVGYFIVLGAVASLCVSGYRDAREILWLVPLCASPIGVLLLLIDRRTRDAYHAAIRAGKALENPEPGFFTRIADEVSVPLSTDKPTSRRITHSTIIQISYGTGSVFLLFLAAMLYIRYA